MQNVRILYKGKGKLCEDGLFFLFENLFSPITTESMERLLVEVQTEAVQAI